MGVELTEVRTKAKITNIVGRQEFLPVLTETMDVLADTIAITAGPHGRQVIIDNHDITKRIRTKDGHTVAKNIKIRGALEEHIRDELVDLTTYIAETVGDGTTGAALMAKYTVKHIIGFLKEYPQFREFDVKETFKEVISDIQARIMKDAKEFEPVDAYDIAYTATNGDKLLASLIAGIYKEVGSNCYINIDYSNVGETGAYTSEAGLTVGGGYIDTCYSVRGNECVMQHPHIYFFRDPLIQDMDMFEMFQKIIENNIINTALYHQGMKDPIPTLIMIPTEISQDLNPILDGIKQGMIANRGLIPLCIVKVPLVSVPEYKDVMDILVPNRKIAKIISEEWTDKLQEKAEIPTIDTVTEWYGTCDEVIITDKKTTFKLPEGFDKSFIEATAKKIQIDLDDQMKSPNADAGVIGILRRRLHALQGNFATLFVGGISNMETESVRAAVEDAVMNCRSCVEFGYGFGSMFQMCKAADECWVDYGYCGEEIDLRQQVIKTVDDIITDAICHLYSISGMDRDVAMATINSNLVNGKPINLRTGTYKDEDRVLTSIKTDVEILEGIKNVILDMIFSGAAILEDPMANIYRG